MLLRGSSASSERDFKGFVRGRGRLFTNALTIIYLWFKQPSFFCRFLFKLAKYARIHLFFRFQANSLEITRRTQIFSKQVYLFRNTYKNIPEILAILSAKITSGSTLWEWDVEIHRQKRIHFPQNQTTHRTFLVPNQKTGNNAERKCRKSQPSVEEKKTVQGSRKDQGGDGGLATVYNSKIEKRDQPPKLLFCAISLLKLFFSSQPSRSHCSCDIEKLFFCSRLFFVIVTWVFFLIKSVGFSWWFEILLPEIMQKVTQNQRDYTVRDAFWLTGLRNFVSNVL